MLAKEINRSTPIAPTMLYCRGVLITEGHFTTQNSVRDFPDFGNPKKNWPGFRDFVQIWQRFPDFRKFLSRISGFPGISKTFKSTKFHLAFFLAFSPHRGSCAAKIPEVWGCDTPPPTDKLAQFAGQSNPFAGQ